MLKKLLAIPALGAALIGGGGAIAASAAPAGAQYLPAPYNAPRQNVVRGIVTYFYQYNMAVQAPNGATVTVQLHPGTIINPIGATPGPGAPVAIRGYWANGAFVANHIRIR
jgi:hypothetical protein